VRALFDYAPGDDELIPCVQAGVAFRVGDVLQVHNNYQQSLLNPLEEIVL